MKYEVRQNGVLKMSTNDKAAFYTKLTRAQMRKAGYELFKDGKLFTEEEKTK